MDPLTLTALRSSIEKWERILAGTDTERGWENCPLCLVFMEEVDEYEDNEHCSGCHGCPVKQAVDQAGCNGTPYKKWRSGWSKTTADNDEKRAVALEELNFLKSLLPLDEQKEG